MSARAQIRPALEHVAAELRRRFGVHVDVAMLRVLRDYGVECHALGEQHAHSKLTIPAPADDAPDAAVDDVTGRYLIPHPHASSNTKG